jgi:hypothetical protein
MATFGTFVAGQVLTAAELNTAGAWNDYTPSWTQSATITKTVNWARYTQLGKWVQVSIKMTASSAGTANNKILVGLPVSASSNNFLMGILTRGSNDPNFASGSFAVYDSATTVAFGVSGTANTPAGVYRLGQYDTSNNGLTIASGSIFQIMLSYEAA